MHSVDDFKNSCGRWVRSFKPHGQAQVWTQAGRLYGDMLKRATPGSRTQRLRTTYEGCFTSFSSFEDFCEWCQNQTGYKDRFHLDKDLLVKGNKEYGKGLCVFLPRDLNNLLSNSKASRGTYPVGVTKESRSDKFRATLKSLPRSYLGLYSTIDEAFAAYKKAKESFMRQQANQWRSQIDPRAYDALMNYQVEITD